MKKLLLLLLPALLLASCKKEESQIDIDIRHAQALAGTYHYRRVGDLNYHGQKETMDVSGIATITHGIANSFQIEVKDESENYIIEGMVISGDFVIQRYSSTYYNSSNEFRAEFETTPAECVADRFNILIHESYHGTVEFPNPGYSCTGSGLLSFTRQ